MKALVDGEHRGGVVRDGEDVKVVGHRVLLGPVGNKMAISANSESQTLNQSPFIFWCSQFPMVICLWCSPLSLDYDRCLCVCNLGSSLNSAVLLLLVIYLIVQVSSLAFVYLELSGIYNFAYLMRLESA